MANPNCPLTLMQMGGLLESFQEAAPYNNLKSFDSKMRKNERVPCTLELHKNILKLK